MPVPAGGKGWPVPIGGVPLGAEDDIGSATEKLLGELLTGTLLDEALTD